MKGSAKKKTRVAIQGERGSFSHEAALNMIPGCEVVACSVSSEVFQALKSGKAAVAVIPIENSLAGSVAVHYDLLLAQNVTITREFFLRIRHNLMALPGVRLGDVEQVFSHQVALDQCRDFFRKHRRVKPVPYYDTAGGVKHVVAEQLRDSAAIGPEQAAKEYGAHILARGLEDDKQNWTRFLQVEPARKGSPKPGPATGEWKLSLVFSLPNTPGALFKSLSVFALRDLNLTKIESRPVRGKPWEYVFYADVLTSYDARAERAIAQLEEICGMVKVLGSYPAVKAPKAK